MSRYCLITDSFMERHFGEKLRTNFMTNGKDFHDERSIFSSWQVEIFIMTGRDFHEERSRFSAWKVQIFMMNGRDFHHGRSRFSSWQVEISSWQVKIFIVKSPHFDHDRSRFSPWQIQIFIMAGPELLIARTKIPEREGRISPSSFYGQLSDY